MKIQAWLCALLASGVCLFGGACAAAGQSAEDATYQIIDAETAKEMMDANTDAIIVDVRTQKEFDEGHIAGAISIANESIGKEMPALLPDLEAEILVYCRSGNRSAQAAEKLAALGYTHIYDFGGLSDWPYPL